MKALLSKFSRNKQNNSNNNNNNNTTTTINLNSPIREKSSNQPILPPLPQWPPQQPQQQPQQRVADSPMFTAKPLPVLVPSPPQQATARHEPIAATSPPKRQSDIALTRTRSPPQPIGSARKSNNHTSVGTSSATTPTDKKVAFLSPPPTPADMRALTSTIAATTNVQRPDSGSRTNLSRTSGKISDLHSRNVHSPSRQLSSESMSYRSGTPYSQSANSSRILAAPSWSEAAEEDLVSNLGPRERTRQEVLWEIVASEERYVAELVKMKETFIDPLLHPFSSVAAPSSPSLPESSMSPLRMNMDDMYYRQSSPTESLDNLPIASRYLSTVLDTAPGLTTGPPSALPIAGESSEDEEGDDKVGRGYSQSSSGHGTPANNNVTHPRSPYRRLPFPSRSHQSLPPPPRGTASAASLGRQSVSPVAYQDDELRRSSATPSSRLGMRKLRRSNAPSTPESPSHSKSRQGTVPPHLLPDEFRRCLEVIEGGILNGHTTLSEGLRKRYEEQYPLVRSLADVFVANSHILHEYATYVLHLERALEQVDSALANSNDPKKSKNGQDQDWNRIVKLLQRLEESAAEKAETGLAISLSKPFQRLLKYPLLFQNLLFHTDPSTYEYESTLQMVAEVETIVRSIEDEKIQKDERDRTRDALARIEGLQNIRELSAPKSSRVLLEEKSLHPGLYSPSSSSSVPSTPKGAAVNGKGKSSFKRFSDILQPGTNGAGTIGKKKDLWLVVFNDVVLRCQRTGVTTLPLATTANARTNSMPELQGKTKYATTGRRGAQVKPRNLYKFISIDNWTSEEARSQEVGNAPLEDALRESEAGANSSPVHGDEYDSDDSDRKSKMSFSYWGADKVTIQKSASMKKNRVSSPSSGLRGGRRGSPLGTAAYGRESSANAKFGTRLVSEGSPAKAAARPSSRRHGGYGGNVVPRRPSGGQSEDHSTSKTTVASRPAWDGSTRATPTASRTRTISQTAALQTPQAASPQTKVASIAPSEDSGVGLYRQMMAQNPSFNHIDNE